MRTYKLYVYKNNIYSFVYTNNTTLLKKVFTVSSNTNDR